MYGVTDLCLATRYPWVYDGVHIITFHHLFKYLEFAVASTAYSIPLLTPIVLGREICNCTLLLDYRSVTLSGDTRECSDPSGFPVLIGGIVYYQSFPYLHVPRRLPLALPVLG